MSTLADIQDAVMHLNPDEKKALSLWLSSQAACDLSSEDERRLLRSLDEAVRNIDVGRGVPLADVRKMQLLTTSSDSSAPRHE
jgi:hypothetical protein